MSEELARQIKTKTDSCTQQLAHVREKCVICKTSNLPKVIEKTSLSKLTAHSQAVVAGRTGVLSNTQKNEKFSA